MSYLSDLLGSAYKEGMTEEEISTALETVGNGNTAEVNRLKAALSKANSEAAEFKKQLRSKQSDDEESLSFFECLEESDVDTSCQTMCD